MICWKDSQDTACPCTHSYDYEQQKDSKQNQQSEKARWMKSRGNQAQAFGVSPSSTIEEAIDCLVLSYDTMGEMWPATGLSRDSVPRIFTRAGHMSIQCQAHPHILDSLA